MKTKQVSRIMIFIMIGSTISFFLNYLLIQHLIIPDPCYYHSHETTKLFDLFYEMTASEGYHPSSTKFNLIFTLLIGAILGLISGLIWNFKIRKKDGIENH